MSALYRARQHIIAGDFVPPVEQVRVQPAGVLRRTLAGAWHRVFG